MTADSRAVTTGLARPGPASRVELERRSDDIALIRAAARLWFAVAVAGQWLFAFYVALFYGGAAARGDWAAWNKALPRGLLVDDPVRNGVLVAQLLLAAVITVLGPLQLIPQVRARAPRLHRWMGRVYIPVAFVMSDGGQYMLLTRGTVGDDSRAHRDRPECPGDHDVCDDGLVQRARDAATKPIAAGPCGFSWSSTAYGSSAVGLMHWLVIHQRPVDFDPKMLLRPFLTFLANAQFVLTLAVLELYLRLHGTAAAGRNGSQRRPACSCSPRRWGWASSARSWACGCRRLALAAHERARGSQPHTACATLHHQPAACRAAPAPRCCCRARCC